MKKIASIFAMLLMVVTISLSLNSCGGVTASALADNYNKQCPIDAGNGCTIESVVAEGSTMVFNLSIPEELDPATIAASADKAAMVAAMKAQDKDFIEGCAALGCSVKYVYQNANGKGEVLISADEMK
jgi:hypothetical protein